MRKSSKILVFIFFAVAAGLIFFVNKADESEIMAAVEQRTAEAVAERERALAEREQTLADTLAAREARLVADFQARQAALDSALQQIDDPVYHSVDGSLVVQILRRMGLDPELGTEDDGDPKLTFTLSTFNATMFFYGCTDGAACRSLRLFVGFNLITPPTLELLNEWNRTKRFGTAYRNNKNWACLDADLIVHGGIRASTIEAYVRNYRDRLAEFARHIDF